MGRAWSWYGVSCLLLTIWGSAPGADATVVEKRIRHTILPDGGVLEETHLEVRLDATDELEDWSPHYIYLDDHRTLEKITATATRPDGSRVTVKSKRQDRLEVSQPGILHGSAVFQEVPFPYLPKGSVLSIETRIRVDPYFPSGSIYLAEASPTENLVVEVKGAPTGWRWRLEGSATGLKSEESGGTLTLRASRLPDAETSSDEDDTGKAPTLRYAWGPKGSWREVARWYENMLQDLPRRDETVASQARELVAGFEEPRERLEALLDFMRRDVRYVAVEVGIGGYRPSPPDAVLKRRWGDCKDKALLFIDLLEEVGIQSYPALIRSSANDDVDPNFPAPDRFNHMIVAVPAEAVAIDDDDPTAGDLLFIDPTQEQGTARWLHPGVQRKGALVIRGDESALIVTPDRWYQERQQLRVDLTISPTGDVVGQAEVLVTGNMAVAVARELESPRAEEIFLRFLGRRLPRFDLRGPSWQHEPGDVPALRLAAEVHSEGFVAGIETRPSLHLPGLPATPLPRELTADGKADLRPGSWLARWRFHLPSDWCSPKASESTAANDIGSFRQTITPTDQGFEVMRRTDVRARWAAGTSMAALKEVSLAEHRALKRRLRLHCQESADAS